MVAVMGGAVTAGISVAPAVASASPVNLIQNGTFEDVATTTTTYQPVLAGNSTTIADWTVDTPALYGERKGSVDVTSDKYWNAYDSDFSIDLAGSTGAPGGIYQDVATTPGAEYSLSFYSAVNGYQKVGKKHTMDVSVDGTEVDTVKSTSAGMPLNWVANTATFIAPTSSSQIEFDDATLKDRHQGPTLDDVSLVAVPDSITASAVAIPTQAVGTPFTTPVATFTDSYPSAPTSDFTATIFWGDGGSNTGTITQSGSTYTVTGSYDYDGDGNPTVEVDIASVGGGSASVDEPVSVVDSITTCTGEICSGSESDGTESVQFTSPSDTGTIDASQDPDTSNECGDPFRHAPEIVTVTDTGVTADITFTITFDNDSAAGDWYVPFAVCYESTTPFTDYFGNTGVTTGLLPNCGNPVVAPCTQSIVESPDAMGNPQDTGTVVETIVVPPGDPRFH